MRKLLAAVTVAVAALTLAGSALAATLNTNCHPGETAWGLFTTYPGPSAGSAVDFNYLSAGRRTVIIGIAACPPLTGGCNGGIRHGASYPWGTISLTVTALGAHFTAGGCVTAYGPVPSGAAARSPLGNPLADTYTIGL